MTNEIKASFDLTTKEGKKRKFNAMNGSAKSMKDLAKDTVLEVAGVMIHEGVNENGEVNTVTTLFATDGDAYASISATVSKAANELVDFIEDGEVVQVKVVKAESKGGREFLNLQLV